MPDRVPRRTLTLWRAYVPVWAHQPLSGGGPARFGGRWNPVGLPTIYAALEPSTAFAEYNQGFVQHPATLAQLRLEGARLADLTDADMRLRLGVGPDIQAVQWRAALEQGETPETHRLQEKLFADGFDGVIYPSFMSPGGTCVALWRWNAPGGPTLTVVDPEGRLPKTPASWL